MRSYILVYSQYSNMFYPLKAPAPPKQTELFNKLHTYLDTKVEAIDDVIAWWDTAPSIHDYHAWHLIISLYLVLNTVNFKSKTNYLFLATSIDIEQLFSHGHGLLPHTHNCLSAQSTHALLCLGSWSKAGFVHDNDVKAVDALPDVVSVDSQVLENEQ